jgi:hypothetical protein
MKHLAPILAALALTVAAASAQTNIGLFYNATNFTVIGWTNTNPLTFTNAVALADQASPTKRVTFDVSGVATNTTRTLTVPDESGTVALINSGSTPVDAALRLYDPDNGYYPAVINAGLFAVQNYSEFKAVFDPFSLTTNHVFIFPNASGTFLLSSGNLGGLANTATARSNVFGAPGLSATITNGGLVFVFTNGILASTNAP